MKRKPRVYLALLALILILPACNKLNSKPQSADVQGGLRKNIASFDRNLIMADLQSIGSAYQSYLASHDNPPTKPEDIKDLEKEKSSAYQGILDGRYVVYWNVRPDKLPAGAGKTILAYSKEGEDKGGPVPALFADNHVDANLSLAAFKAAAKPQ